ncbi:DNA-methyltransferase [Curtobacterium sp. Curtsp57]|uniref:DNA-methyltransferase n=1 Tax=Curtobacterium sp. Curtsp57 TaxID=3243047 RepID=UPI0039B405FB
MKPHYEAAGVTLFHGDCLDVLRELPDESVHAVVTDPPYGLSNTDPGHVSEAITHWTTGDRSFLPSAGGGFMGKAWDEFVPPPAVWDECMRVLKPGGHLLAFAGSRTIDLMALSIRLAGFDIRDSIAWLYGSGFPKSMDVAKAVEAHVLVGGSHTSQKRRAAMGDEYAPSAATGTFRQVESSMDNVRTTPPSFEPTTDEAKAWDGWGTALKPAFEPIVVARKPIIGTVAKNVLAHGSGALNIDAVRTPTTDPLGGGAQSGSGLTTKSDGWARPWMADVDARTAHAERVTANVEKAESLGRWPANVVLDESQATELDRQAPDTGGSGRASGPSLRGATTAGAAFGARNGLPDDREPAFYGDRGGASRMFPTFSTTDEDWAWEARVRSLPTFRYEAKAPTSERPVVDGVAHPTVKPLDLMRWLVRLVTPKGGTLLEPFAGSGTTVEACLREGFDVIAIEREADYLPLIEKRIRKDHAQGLDFDWGEAS